MAVSVYTRYYLQQSGHGSDNRFGAPYISPLVLQRGYGLGGIFSTVARYLTPIFGALKDTVFTAGKNVLHDIGRKPLNDILMEQGKLAASTLTDRSAKQMHEWIGAGRKGIKRRALQGGGLSSMGKRARTSASTSIATTTTRTGGAGRRKRTTHRKRKTKATIGAGRRRQRRPRAARKSTKRRTRRKRTLDIFS